MRAGIGFAVVEPLRHCARATEMAHRRLPSVACVLAFRRPCPRPHGRWLISPAIVRGQSPIRAGALQPFCGNPEFAPLSERWWRANLFQRAGGLRKPEFLLIL